MSIVSPIFQKNRNVCSYLLYGQSSHLFKRYHKIVPTIRLWKKAGQLLISRSAFFFAITPYMLHMRIYRWLL
ncbi:hypothetical protein ACFOU2_17120, partial [Bacillus songklensis]